MPDIRNFSIIAHIDHGKTTLTDRLLELTHTVSQREFTERLMDSNPIEKERGITIKLAPVRMEYHGTILNLIDTPGHVDFGYEVSRSLAACEGALLVVDATQGVQAQTLSNYEKAKELGLDIIPVINKIDLPSADVDAAKLELMELFGVEEQKIVAVSAKTGQNTEALMEAVTKYIRPPQGKKDAPLRALVFTSQFDQHKGVIAYIRVIDGVLDKQKLQLMATKANFLPIELGVFTPHMTPTDRLEAGEVGYICTGLKEVSQVTVGDTITTTSAADHVTRLPGYKEPLPMVYMEFYPIDGDDFVLLQDAMAKLSLHDAALRFSGTHSPALGNGLRVGFLGILHAEIVRERLEREFNLELIATSPSVTYEVERTDGTEMVVKTPAEMPDPATIRQIKEPMTHAILFTPKSYLGAVMQLAEDHRGKLLSMQDVGTRVRIEYELPLAEIIVHFHDHLKSVSSGFASLEYDVTGYVPVDAVKLNIIVQHEQIDALSVIVVRENAEKIGRALVKRLKEVVPRQQFEVPIQAAIGGKVIARETIKAYRKDVTAHLYGGDVTRRQKLLKKQAKGKKRMKEIGKVQLNQEAFMAVLER
ncbi:elongation factor 4 [Patescibacteria group bacterium]|nr:elongation factor 4 [Patescibacteria group bacterium]